MRVEIRNRISQPGPVSRRRLLCDTGAGFALALFATTIGVGHALADDERVWVALKVGGKVILMRHTHVDIREGIGRLAPGNCAAEVNLSSRGVEQARSMGEAFRARGVKVGEVLTSPYCRCMDTGRLAFGRANPVPYLLPPGVVSEAQAKLNQDRVLQEIVKHRGPANLVMITHGLNVANIVLQPGVHMGQFFVLQPRDADFDVVGDVWMNGK